VGCCHGPSHINEGGKWWSLRAMSRGWLKLPELALGLSGSRRDGVQGPFHGIEAGGMA
jgi:hypothetical protein